jgi:hypothetical protein
MQSFSILLKNERSRSYDRIAFFILFLNLIAFSFLAIYSVHGFRTKAIGGIIISIIGFGIDFFLRKIKKNEGLPYRQFIHFGISVAWINMGLWIPAAINVILGMQYFFSKKKLLVSVDQSHITYPALLNDKINWEDVSAVILKDGLLTIDLKNNKLIQQDIDESNPVDEKSFNEFCKKKLLAINAKNK